MLKTDPSLVVRTVPELFGLARTLSARAVELYRALGERMADFGNEGARRAFAAIEAERRRHAEALENRTPPDLRRPADPVRAWADLAVFDDEELAGTRLVTPYRALAVAVRNQDRAFSFWTYVSAHAAAPEVRAEAERMALDELSHVTDLRAARRLAWHEMRRRDGERARRLREMPLPGFRAECAREEATLAALHEMIAGELARAGHPEAATLARLADEEAESARALGGSEAPDVPGPLPDASAALVNLALERLEAAAELYLQAAETSPDDAVVAEAQRLSEAAVRRLSEFTS